MTELNELECELDGVLLVLTERGDSGLDDTAEIESDDQSAAGDGEAISEQRLSSRAIELTTNLLPGNGLVTDDDHDVFAAALQELRVVMSPLPDRTQTRLLRWRRIGEVTKQIRVRPAPGKSLVVPGDINRLVYAAAEIGVRLVAADPVVLSDEVHTYEFEAGETATITNAGSFCAVHPTAWSLTSAVPVTLENLDFDEYVRFPVGPVTVSRTREVVATGSYGIQYGPASTLFPRWPLLRPGDNTIKASAACTLSWQDTW